MSTRQEHNALLTQTAPGTAMGDLFRRYWLPALLAEELPQPDCPPVRVQILSERLIAFRDTSGKLGLIDEFCAHRGVSLWFGRNEQNGLRCAYHGWKFDVTGQCVEVPSEQDNPSFAARVRLTSYPLVERGGVLWAYMGPPELQPQLPAYEFTTVAAPSRYVSKRHQACNYLQAMEGGIDPHHVSFLHSGEVRGADMIATDNLGKYLRPELAVKMEIEPSAGGLVIAYGRETEEGGGYWRVMQWVLPCYTLIPPFGDHPVHGHFWTPIDDEHCWAWTFDFHPTRALTQQEMDAALSGRGLHVKTIPGTYMPVANKGNDYLIDRSKQKAGVHYSGVESIGMQDASLQESMGPIQDRAKEHLASSDRPIVMARRELRAAAMGLRDGIVPRGTQPAAQRLRSVTTVIPPGQQVLDVAKPAMGAGPGVPFLSA
ncbi:MAG: Rieske (2Fe-2S) iron-sulfur domain protein [Ramlibacter sp.]|jgi:phthalate 4,5-dioxygenase oxygenase subunit|uniref:aromatic ring-hydroxylating dioxygenase subunit alpha n=1 Tax=Ramlibacter sp. TaxID=1917967 RepID=UPI002636A6E7|nr:aromatic ring-hydroxylating dioxygenase subunit alpha [Ramlibacter sp.]MDB5750036.1 Rieske (2Fe-2S) iron-sulfur domain protein [Ramlibacter sp.]